MASPELQVISSLNKKITTLMLEHSHASFEEKLQVSIKALQEASKVTDELYVMFSGGKDSLVTLDLTLRTVPREKVRVVYIEITGNTHEENLRYTYKTVLQDYEIPRQDFIHLKATHDFYECVKRWGWPGPRRKWCMTTFKKNVVNKHLGEDTVSVTGVKFHDSGWRKRWIQAGAFWKIPGWKTIYLKPIFHWTTQDINTYIQRYIKPKGIDKCPLYYEIGGSGNCTYCPLHYDPQYYAQLFKKYPHWMKKLLDAEQAVQKGAPFIQGKGKKIYFKDIIHEMNSLNL